MIQVLVGLVGAAYPVELRMALKRKRFRLGWGKWLAVGGTFGLIQIFAAGYAPRVFRMGFTPVESGSTMQQIAAPVVAAMSKAIGIKVEAFVAADYVGTVEALRSKKVDAALLSPTAMILAQRKANARPILRTSYKGHAHYYAVVFVRRDSPIKKLSDLKGKSFAFVDPGSTSGFVVPQLVLKSAGIRADRDFKQVIYAGTHDAVLMAVLHRQAAAGATFQKEKGVWPLAESLKKRADLNQLRVIAYSDPIPEQGIAVNATLDETLTKRLIHFFLGLSATAEGRAMIAKFYQVDAFIPAGSTDWKPVEDAFLAIGRKL